MCASKPFTGEYYRFQTSPETVHCLLFWHFTIKDTLHDAVQNYADHLNRFVSKQVVSRKHFRHWKWTELFDASTQYSSFSHISPHPLISNWTVMQYHIASPLNEPEKRQKESWHHPQFGTTIQPYFSPAVITVCCSVAVLWAGISVRIPNCEQMLLWPSHLRQIWEGCVLSDILNGSHLVTLRDF